jgi:tripartite-type tricarboxylate transporter receptor subunit TctC
MKRQPQGKRAMRIVVLGLLMACSMATLAQSWPAKPVRIVAPFAVGGPSDSMARITATRLTQNFGVPFIVENKVGTGGVIAADYVAKAQPDGYTLSWATSPQLVVLPNITKPPYDPVRDFAPISIVGTFMFALAVHDSIPTQTLAQFVAYAKGRPGKLPYGTAGNGSIPHLTMALFTHRAGLDMIVVHYKGAAPAMNELLGGQLTACFCALADVTAQAASGRLKVLAVSGSKRSRLLPNVPTVAEQGYPDFHTDAWNGLAAPAKTPRAIIDRIAGEIAASLKDKEFVERLESIGVDPVGNSPTEFAAVLQEDLKTWAEAAKIAGEKLE